MKIAERESEDEEREQRGGKIEGEAACEGGRANIACEGGKANIAFEGAHTRVYRCPVRVA